ncbi:MAG TPA: HlyD family secretion protein [Candidatus Binataceae bacterium]|nr:HlyD family secretion protein [Candidatus Binataceae bacterium]
MTHLSENSTSDHGATSELRATDPDRCKLTNHAAEEAGAGPADDALRGDLAYRTPLKAYQPDRAPDRAGAFTDPAPDPVPPPKADGRRPGRAAGRLLLPLLLALAVIAAAPWVWNYLESYETTDDAQIDGHIDPLSSRIDGTVIAVHAEDDDRVRRGDLLVEIDPRDYEVAVAAARARLALALAQVAAARQDYAAALAQVREAAATNFRAQRDARRYAALLEQQVVPQEQYDQYHAAAGVEAARVASAAEAAGSALKAIAAREAEVDAARAALDQALLNLSYTKIYAPADGIVGHRAVQLGSRIQPAETLMFVTETDHLWVMANFKETQLARIHRGEPVTIHVDTFGRDYRGHVVNLPGASGDRFSLLPPENATGNYVKVVQRLPVRIAFDPGQDLHRLHLGMSVEPTVWLR